MDPGQQPQHSQAMLSPKGSVLQSTFTGPQKNPSVSKTFDNRRVNDNQGTSLLDDDNFNDDMLNEVINPDSGKIVEEDNDVLTTGRHHSWSNADIGPGLDHIQEVSLETNTKKNVKNDFDLDDLESLTDDDEDEKDTGEQQ